MSQPKRDPVRCTNTRTCVLKGGALFWAVIHHTDQEAAKPQWLLTERGQGGNKQEFFLKIKPKTRGFLVIWTWIQPKSK